MTTNIPESISTAAPTLTIRSAGMDQESAGDDRQSTGVTGDSHDSVADSAQPHDLSGQTAGEECESCATHHHGYIKEKDAFLKRMRRIEGQARGITKMIEDEKYCIDILTQISAMTKALEAVGLGLLDDHLKHCVLDAAKAGGDEADAKMKEASDAIKRMVR